MVRAQVERERQRKQQSREEFLASLNVEVALLEVESIESPDFPRTLELINKSNQFNTTGRRWTQQECVAALDQNTRFFVFEVKDKFTRYGIVGVVICEDSHIAQFVMSCRVVGLDVEIGVIAELLRVLRSGMGVSSITAAMTETALNLLARDLWERCGFKAGSERWSHDGSPELARPPHINVSTAARGVPASLEAAQ